MNRSRILLAFALSPLATPLFFAAVWAVIGTLDLERLGMLMLFIGAFAYAAALIFGVPLVTVTRRLNMTSKTVFIVAGAWAGFLTTLIPSLIFGSFGGFWFYAMCCVAGSLSSFAFWLIAFAKWEEAVELSPGNS